MYFILNCLLFICLNYLKLFAIPFAYTNKAVGDLNETKDEWIGSVAESDYLYYADTFLVLVFGGIPWQVYFQRVLSAKTEKTAMYLSYVAAFGCFIAGIPPTIVGIIAKSTGKFILIHFNLKFNF